MHPSHYRRAGGHWNRTNGNREDRGVHASDFDESKVCPGNRTPRLNPRADERACGAIGRTCQSIGLVHRYQNTGSLRRHWAKTQIEAIRQGVDIIIATPGRFMELYLKNEI